MSIQDIAMKKHMEHIVKVEDRPFSVVDFDQFEVAGKLHHVSKGTFRNKMSEWKEKGEVILQYTDTYAYYSLPGYEFSKSSLMTKDHEGLPIKIAKQTPIYKWFIKQPIEKQALHNFRLLFRATGIWLYFSKIFPNLVNKLNKDIPLEIWKFIDEIDVHVTIHHTDRVSIAIACSSRPLAIDMPDILYLIEILTRTEEKIKSYCYSEKEDELIKNIPRYTTWIVKMWHFGIDFENEYNDKEFHVTFQEGISDLWRIYTKRLSDGKLHVRREHQEYSDKPITEALLDKILGGFET
jgi:hypothetical protein